MSESPSDPRTFEDAIDQVFAHMKDVLVRKQRDYGHGNILAFGEPGVLVRASDKLERLKNLYCNDQTPENESVDDTWLDLANYAVIAQMLRRGTFTLPLDGGARTRGR